MKRFSVHIFAACLLAGTTAKAQFRTKDRMDNLTDFDEKKYSWGFFLNLNNFDYRLVLDPKYGMNEKQNSVASKSSYSFGAGLMGKMKISDNVDLRVEPGLQFVQRELYFNTQSNDQYRDGTGQFPAFETIPLTESDKLRTVKSTYLDIPVLIEVHGDRWYNSRPYAAAGVNWMMNLQSNANSTEDNQQQIFRTTSSNFAWSAEMGIQLYFSKFKLTPGFRGTFMFNNELVADNATTPPYWTAAIKQLNTRAFMFVLKFE